MKVDFSRGSEKNIRKTSLYSTIMHGVLLYVNYLIIKDSYFSLVNYLLIILGTINIVISAVYFIKPHKINYLKYLSLPIATLLSIACYMMMFWIIEYDKLYSKEYLLFLLIIHGVVYLASYVFFKKRIYIKFVNEEFRDKKVMTYSLFKLIPLLVIGKLFVRMTNTLVYLIVYILPITSALICTYIFAGMLFKYSLLKYNETEFLDSWYEEELQYNPLNNK